MADASHELRTPVSVIRSAADVTLSRERRDDGEYREALTIVGGGGAASRHARRGHARAGARRRGRLSVAPGQPLSRRGRRRVPSRRRRSRDSSDRSACAPCACRRLRFVATRTCCAGCCSTCFRTRVQHTAAGRRGDGRHVRAQPCDHDPDRPTRGAGSLSRTASASSIGSCSSILRAAATALVSACRSRAGLPKRTAARSISNRADLRAARSASRFRIYDRADPSRLAHPPYLATRPTCPYLYRSACSGLTRVARTAGT